jgi:hypothetical protein
LPAVRLEPESLGEEDLTMANQWYYQMMGEVVGPCSPAELKALAASGRIDPDTQVRKDTDGDWVAARRLTGLFDVAVHPPGASGPAPSSNPYQPGQAPLQPPPNAAWQTQGDATGGLIPYKNVPALLSYYLGVFSLIPCIGLVLAVPAVILGIIGLVQRSKNPAIRGAAHAWVGIVLGGLMTLLWGGCVVFMVIGAMSSGPRGW